MSDFQQCLTTKIINDGEYSDLADMVKDKDVYYLIDSNVFNLYQDYFANETCIIIPSGEESKQLTSTENIYLELLYAGATRKSFIVGVGGGVTLDIAGFVASTYMRGIDFGFVPTTLLAMTDAAIGGKNGVNVEEYKNIIGCFNSPEFVLVDPEYIRTLLDNDVSSGFAEVIKHACIADSELFGMLKSNAEALIKRDMDQVRKILAKSIDIKTSIVNEDAKENGIRKILNFGHTLGHAIERILDISHGEAVAIGMVFASKLSQNFDLIDKEYLKEIIELIELFKLPTEIEIDKNMILDIMLRDKKGHDDMVDFILLNGRGSAIVKTLKKSEIEELIGKYL
jgi:3-dehydroquinate synthase